MSTQITGEAFPLVIDQADITAPDFPRGAEWWRRFVPEWITVDVDGDGTVRLDASKSILPGMQRLNAAQLRNRRAGMVRWVGSSIGRHLAGE